jgi:hypothetical protein
VYPIDTLAGVEVLPSFGVTNLLPRSHDNTPAR